MPSDTAADDFRLLVEGTREYAIYMLDPNGLVASWNAGGARIKGYAASEVVGRHFRQFYLESDRLAQKPEAALAEAIRSGRYMEEGWRVRKDGSAFWASVVITPIFAPGGELRGFGKVTRDLSERQRADEQAKRLLREQAAREEALKVQAELSATKRVKDEFLAALSHELRTPLSGIRGALEILRDLPPDTADFREFLAILTTSVDAQGRVIDAILDSAGLLKGDLALSVAAVDPELELRAAFDGVKSEANSRRVDLRLDVAAGASRLIGDATRVRQIFANILDNAVKFTPSGGSIEVSLTRVDNWVRVSVKDSGAGIGAAFLPFMFQRFRQGDSGSNRRFGGLGLGLAIAQDLAGLHGGQITATNRHGAPGAEFVVDLPVEKAV